MLKTEFFLLSCEVFSNVTFVIRSVVAATHLGELGAGCVGESALAGLERGHGPPVVCRGECFVVVHDLGLVDLEGDGGGVDDRVDDVADGAGRATAVMTVTSPMMVTPVTSS